MDMTRTVLFLCPLTAPPLVLLAWSEPDRVWGATASGAVYRSPDGGVTWQQQGALAGAPAALLATGGVLYAAVHEQGIYRSDDGATWQLYYRDPA